MVVFRWSMLVYIAQILLVVVSFIPSFGHFLCLLCFLDHCNHQNIYFYGTLGMSGCNRSRHTLMVEVRQLNREKTFGWLLALLIGWLSGCVSQSGVQFLIMGILKWGVLSLAISGQGRDPMATFFPLLFQRIFASRRIGEVLEWLALGEGWFMDSFSCHFFGVYF